MESKGHRPLIVVGVDGSESSRFALRWAAQQAECAEADLRVVMAWHLPEIYAYPRDYEAEARSALDDVVGQTLGSDPRVTVVTRLAAGDAAPVLIEESRDAELLVVDSHGHGGFRGMPLRFDHGRHFTCHDSPSGVAWIRHPSRDVSC
jgi:nucleotide-binding universal stress UspA family protein